MSVGSEYFWPVGSPNHRDLDDAGTGGRPGHPVNRAKSRTSSRIHHPPATAESRERRPFFANRFLMCQVHSVSAVRPVIWRAAPCENSGSFNLSISIPGRARRISACTSAAPPGGARFRNSRDGPMPIIAGRMPKERSDRCATTGTRSISLARFATGTVVRAPFLAPIA